jgi:hypothetical protein
MQHELSFRVRGVVSALVIAGMVSMAPGAALAADGKAFGLGAACAVSNVFYGPTKLIYALLGSFTAGMAYAFTAGDIDVARTILDTSVNGDYLVTPEHLQGQKRLQFIGSTTPVVADDDWNAPPENAGF